MNLITVNDDANFIIQLKVDNKWQTLTEEYSASAATNVMSNAHILTKLDVRFLSKRSDNMVIGAITNEVKLSVCHICKEPASVNNTCVNIACVNWLSKCK